MAYYTSALTTQPEDTNLVRMIIFYETQTDLFSLGLIMSENNIFFEVEELKKTRFIRYGRGRKVHKAIPHYVIDLEDYELNY